MPRTCRELEQQHGDSDCKCHHYREEFPDCRCEGCTVSEHSPGQVQDDELLIRTLFSPLQVDIEKGTVAPMAFKDVLTRGLSVDRKRHTGEQELQARIEARIASDIKAGRNKDGFFRVATASCGDIRSALGEEGTRLFCVYDTALKENTAHADVCSSIDPPPKTKDRSAKRKAIYSKLFDIFKGQATDLKTVYTDNK